MKLPKQYIRCCVCGHEFDVPSHIKDLEKCPKCRGRRLMWRFDNCEVLEKAVKVPPVPVAKEKIL